MTDTAPAVEQRYRSLLMARSGEERLKMGCSMHAAAQALVRASVLEQDSLATAAAVRCALFLRFYSQDFALPEREKVLRALNNGS